MLKHPPNWGRLKAQNMIEHLTEAVEYTNGKRIAKLAVSEEEAKQQKQSKVNIDFLIPKFAKGFLPDAYRECQMRGPAIGYS